MNNENLIGIITAVTAAAAPAIGLITWMIKKSMKDHTDERKGWSDFLESHALEEVKLMTEVRDCLRDVSKELAFLRESVKDLRDELPRSR